MIPAPAIRSLGPWGSGGSDAHRIFKGAMPWNPGELPPETSTTIQPQPEVYDYYCVPHEHAGMVGASSSAHRLTRAALDVPMVAAFSELTPLAARAADPGGPATAESR